jgi:microcystin degradation protein MlrC
MTEAIRIAVLNFVHETVTFLPNDTALDDFIHDRSGSATSVLQQVIAQGLADVLIATITDRPAVEAVVARGLKAGDPFDMDVGGLADESLASECGSRARSQARRTSPAGTG